MARTDEEKLVLAVEARITDLERGMARAQKTTNERFKKMTQSAQQNSAAMQKAMQGASRGINIALTQIGIGGLGFSAITAAIGKVNGQLADLGRSARRSGVDVKEFQKWRIVAEENAVGIDSMADSFRELNIRATEYATTGKGGAAEAFAQLGFSPAEIKERLKNPSDLLLEIIDRTRRLKDTAKGVKIFDELLGGSGGEKFVSLIEQGRSGIESTMKQAEEMGLIFDEEWIKRAEEIDRKFKAISSTVGTYLQQAIVDAATALQAFINDFYAFEDRSVGGIKSRKSILETRRIQLEKQAGSAEDTVLGWIGKDAATELAAVEKELSAINDELERRSTITLNTITVDPVKPYDLPSDTINSGGAKRDKAAESARREEKAVLDLIAALEFERSLVGKTDIEREKMVALRRAGAAATEEQKLKIEELVEATYKEQQALDELEAQMIGLREAGRDFTGTLIDGLLSGAKATDVLANALQQLGNRLLQTGLDGLFGLLSGGGAGGGCFGAEITITNFTGASA